MYFNMNCRLYKVTESHQLQYILIVWGNAEAASTIGELAVCQIESLLTAYMEKATKTYLCRIFSLAPILR